MAWKAAATGWVFDVVAARIGLPLSGALEEERLKAKTAAGTAGEDELWEQLHKHERRENANAGIVLVAAGFIAAVSVLARTNPARDTALIAAFVSALLAGAAQIISAERESLFDRRGPKTLEKARRALIRKRAEATLATFALGVSFVALEISALHHF